MGRTAHSARPWQGENAIHKAANFLARLSHLEPVRTQIDGLEWSAVMSATMAKGGRARNIIPDVFEVNVNHRFGPDRTVEQAKAAVLAVVAGDAEVEFVDEAPPALPFRKHPLVEAHAVVAVNFGPGVNSQAHQRNEWTSLSSLATGRDILSRWLGSIST
jgi:succinyl-diaminopimelate desuccinylase